MNILITGGASGLGAAIVERLAKESSDTIYFTYASSAAAAKEMELSYSNVKGFFCDFTDAVSIESLLSQIPGMNIDALINNANGAVRKEHFHKTSPDVFLTSFRENIMPVLSITQEAIKVFRKKKYGKIINIISSYVISKPPIGLSEYVANKSYLLSMSNSWATEGARFNITSNSISPSFMLTGLTADTDERVIDQMKEEHPLKQLLTTGEVAEAVSYFIRASQQINGTNFIINAGADIG